MNIDDDDDSMSVDRKAENLRKLRKAIEDMEGLTDEEEFTDEWYANHVEFFHDIRKTFPDFTVILNPEKLKSVEEAKIMAEENASHLEYEMEIGGTLDVSAFWRFCIAIETIVQAALKLGNDETLMDLLETFDELTIPESIK
jgi:hypothetical protein